MSEIKLLPCPFCGGDKVGVWINRSISPLVRETYEVHCYGCHFGLEPSKTKEEAIEKWNTRKPMQEIVERLEEEAQDCRRYWDEFSDEDSFGGMNAYCDAISIVKEVGGMNDTD